MFLKQKNLAWYPMQQIEFLGVNLDSKIFYISIPQRRIDKCMNSFIQIQRSIKKDRRVHVKCLSIDISTAYNWHAYIKLSKNSPEQIQFWEMNLLKINKVFGFGCNMC